MKSPIKIISLLIRDSEEIAKSQLTSNTTRNDLIQTAEAHRKSLNNDSFNNQRICEVLTDLYSQIYHAFELEPKLKSKFAVVQNHMEIAKSIVLEMTGSFTYKKRGKNEIIGKLDL
ncbi:hypothetical protein PDESU_00383 [Pontiella desulfatans]|uniref:Uncharacterized protein n=1 Tax=Pontiella desulfatans TaxID=2750659 RepID=A0A6C2TX06_PONDE|nr:hypothetical protein [Pontiella desulfatans]VGO11836.1 hypothetical protein PDESU_00383 [Pontiella desulfatans]